MKKVIILFVVVAGSIAAIAQAVSHGKWEENNSSDRVMIRQDNEFANTDISQDNRIITFTDLPQLSKPIWALVTDPSGVQLTQKRVSPANSTMDLRRLPRGEMYFVTLVYRNRSQKAFVLHL